MKCREDKASLIDSLVVKGNSNQCRLDGIVKLTLHVIRSCSRLNLGISNHASILVCIQQISTLFAFDLSDNFSIGSCCYFLWFSTYDEC